MIKVITFDLIGVLVFEKNIKLSELEEKLERKFGPNKSDNDYLEEAKKLINKNNDQLIEMTSNIIDNLYYLKDENLFKKIRNKNNDIIIMIATNHLSYVRKFILNNFQIEKENIIISAEIGKIKPNLNFYEDVVTKSHCQAHEILFVDDNQDNIDGALKLGMHCLKINRGDDVFNKITDYLNRFDLEL